MVHHRCRILCDAALLNAKEMRWVAAEPTPFSRCAHSGVAVRLSGSTGGAEASTSGSSSSAVIVYGGFSGEAVEGDVLQIDCKVGRVPFHFVWPCMICLVAHLS